MKHEPIFIHSLFRAGSTYLYNALKRTGRYTAYHEPFHEVIGVLPTTWNDLVGKTEELKSLLRHEFLSGSYFDEYAHQLPHIKRVFDPSISFELFFLQANESAEKLKAYIDCLIEGALGIPVFQCTRSIGRIEWIRQNYPSRSIFLLRNPWDQWYSYKVDRYISSTPQLIYSQPNLPAVLQRVAGARGFVPLAGDSISESLDYAYEHPLTPQDDYSLFMGLWCYSYMAAASACDLVLDMDAISSSEVERASALERLNALGLDVTLDDYNLHRARFKPHEASFFSHIESQTIETFRRSGFDVVPVTSYLDAQRTTSFSIGRADRVERDSALEDAARMRAYLGKLEDIYSSSTRALRQVLAERDGEMKALASAAGERDAQILRLAQIVAEGERTAQLLSIRLAEREQSRVADQQTIKALSALVAESAVETQELHILAARLEAQARALTAQLGEIEVSKAWRVAMLMRRVRVWLAPPGSSRARLTRRVLLTILPSLRSWTIERDLALLRKSDLYDEAWYLATNPVVAQARVDPAQNYLLYGGFEGRDPSPRFSSAGYLNLYEEVRKAKINPLVHFLRFGQREGRIPRQGRGHRELQVSARGRSADSHPGAAGATEGEISAARDFRPAERDGEARAANAQVVERGGQQDQGEAGKIAIASTTVSPSSPRQPLTFFTIGSKNFTAVAKTLSDSLREHHPDADMYMFLSDLVDSGYDPGLLPFKTVLLGDLAIPHVEEMAQRYNITEFNTALKPHAFAYLFERLGKERVVYLDPDILIVSPLVEVVEEFARGAECVLTPHILEPAENAEMSDHKMLLFGIYNLGFLGLRNTPDVIRAVQWLGRRVEHDCRIDLERGLFVDQKWVDLFPAFISGTAVLRHPGYNVAYWNLSQRRVEQIDGRWYSNGAPLRFVHFSGHGFDNPYVFSRHAGSFNRDNIGDLKHLLDSYRQRVFANNHWEYSRLPYSFNWNGANGVNLHTPKPARQTDGRHPEPAGDAVPKTPVSNAEPITEHEAARQYRVEGPQGSSHVHQPSWLATVLVAHEIAGGWRQMLRRGLRALGGGGLHAIKHRIGIARTIAIREKTRVARHTIGADRSRLRAPSGGATRIDIETQPIPRVFVADWSTPRPDQDAGSLSTFFLLKILVELGYDVTFLPSDLERQSEYEDAVARLGVRCLLRDNIGTVHDHLSRHGGDYSAFILIRAPIAALYLEDIRKYAPTAKVVLDTVDLHYLREERAALIEGTDEAIGAARRAKEWELSIISRCDVAIVLSPLERELLAQELPQTDIQCMPLLFLDMDGGPHARFEQRKDILFIGGFRHLPNIDAVVWFCQDIWPHVRRNLPGVEFFIVGSYPTPEVVALEKSPGVKVLGHVKDIAPIFGAVRLSVAPLRYGAGIKGKVVTSLGYGVPVVGSGIAFEGMELQDNKHVVVADDAHAFADAVVRLYSDSERWTYHSSEGWRRAQELFSESAGRARVKGLMDSLNLKSSDFEFFRFGSIEEYRAHRHNAMDEYRQREQVELELIRHDTKEFYVDGYCAVCREPTMFRVGFMYSTKSTADGKPIPNWREHLDCIECGFVTRVRLVLHLLQTVIRPPADARIYVTEQTTPLFRWIESRFSGAIGSEYLGESLPLGASRGSLRNEDLTRLTFPGESFHLIVSLDVLEHVDDHLAAVAECYRCLAPGGTLVLTAPFDLDSERNTTRARVKPDGTIEHLIMPPEYHGNPVDPAKGSLCFRYFGWEVLEQLKSAGFTEVRLITTWSRDLAYLGGEQVVVTACKGTA